LQEVKRAFEIDPVRAAPFFYNLMAWNLKPEGLVDVINDIKKRSSWNRSHCAELDPVSAPADERILFVLADAYLSRMLPRGH
jgi:hypothetical protein